MSVGSWQPGVGELSVAVVRRLMRAAEAGAADNFGLDAAEVEALAVFARDAGAGSAVDWAAAGAALDDASIEALIRFFVRAEMTFAAWKGGERSPVIALARVLKGRGTYPAGLSGWIRANSDNRFLPYGSLASRL